MRRRQPVRYVLFAILGALRGSPDIVPVWWRAKIVSEKIDERPVDTRRKASWARLIQKVYEVDPLKCTRCGGNMRIIALIDDVDVIERILKQPKVWNPRPDTLTPTGPDPPLPEGETQSLTYHPVPDIA